LDLSAKQCQRERLAVWLIDQKTNKLRPRPRHQEKGTARRFVADLYALAIGGVDGLVSQLRALLAELDLLMAVDGYPSIADLKAAGAKRI